MAEKRDFYTREDAKNILKKCKQNQEKHNSYMKKSFL